jgi:elongation factor P
MIDGNDIRNGISIVADGILYQVIEAQHIKPGKGAAFVRVRLRNMRTKNVTEKTFRAEEKVEDAFIENKRFQYLYHTGTSYSFMDTESYEELHISEEVLGEKSHFLKDGMELTAQCYNGEIIDINLPIFIELKVATTEPGIKGDTAKASLKSATLESGGVVQVPLFINTGDTIKIDTRTYEYVERV